MKLEYKTGKVKEK